MKQFIKKWYVKSLLCAVILVTTAAAFSGDHGSIYPW